MIFFIHQAIEDEFGELDIDELMKHKSSDLYALYELYTLKEELNSTELAFEDVYINTEDGCVVVTSIFRRDRNNYDMSFILQKTR